MACTFCGCTDFACIEDRYFACQGCGRQDSENATDHAEIDMDKDGKTRFGSTNSSAMIDKQGNLLLDVSMPFEPPTKFSIGSVSTTDASRKLSKRLRVNRLIEDVLVRLVDPLNIHHAMDVVQRVRRTASGMLNQILYTEDDDLQVDDDDFVEDSDHVKNRGMRKRAIFVHLITRVILHFIPDYDDRKYRTEVLMPYFSSRVCHDVKKFNKFIFKFGVPVLKRVFPQFDRLYEDDFMLHQQCKVRRLFRLLFESGRYSSIFKQDQHYLLFEFAGTILFHPVVLAKLQSWKLWTRVGVMLCIMHLTDPKEVVHFIQQIEDEPVKEVTILNHLSEPIGSSILENVFATSPEWIDVFAQFRAARAFCV